MLRVNDKSVNWNSAILRNPTKSILHHSDFTHFNWYRAFYCSMADKVFQSQPTRMPGRSQR